MSRTNVHTDLPDDVAGHRGERALAQQLIELGDERMHLWFGLDYLPGVSDLDLLLVDEQLGCFAVEVKAISLDWIEGYGLDRCLIRDRVGDRHPLKQASLAQIKLIEYLRSVGMRTLPFFLVTCAFPKILRRDFLDDYPDERIRRQAEGMILAEDLVSTSALRDRLRIAGADPAHGRRPSGAINPKPDVLEALIDTLSPYSRPPLSRADRHRAAILDRNSRAQPTSGKRSAKYLEPAARQPVIFRGAPGTGKTFRLLEIGIAHARAGRRVVFACFNKVLAADLRRLLSGEALASDVTSTIDVVDVWQLLFRYTTWVDGDSGASDLVVALSRTRRQLDTYATICVDEAQDLPQWAFEMLHWHAEPDAEWFIADGPGQELYATEAASFLVEARRVGATEGLRRVYRTAQADFLVAQAMYEHAPASDAIGTWVAKHPLQTSDQLALDLDAEFDRVGALPTYDVIPAPSIGDHRAAVVASYLEVIRRELERASQLGFPGDLAILVPHTHEHSKGVEGRHVCDALRLLDVAFVDQVDPDNRRRLVPAGCVRVVTYHSARGIEAARVLVVGLDKLTAQDDATTRRHRNLAYIALSRARYGTRAVRGHANSGPFADFFGDLVSAYGDAAAEEGRNR